MARPAKESPAALKKRVLAILECFSEADPEPRCELFYKTPYQLLISVVLSAQATDKSVNKAMLPLYELGFSPEVALELGEAGVLERIRTIGLAPTKSKNVIRLTKILMEKHGGQVPRNREALEELPGVGRKTANVVLGELWREPTLAVDPHVYRVSYRLGLHQEKTADKCEQVLLNLIPKEYLPRAHHWFVLHGRYHCTARAPKCSSCLIEGFCPKIDAL